jgi:nucleoside-diphosphate-sugar epimerase
MVGLVLVTGGAGYVGSIVVAELLRGGYSVRVLDTLLHGSVPSLLQVWGNPRFEFLRGDVRDGEARARAVRDVDAVIHLAAIVGDPACARKPELAHEVNFVGTQALLHDSERAGVKRFVFASTCSNYGRIAGNGFAEEGFELAPISLYAETKVASEQDVLSRSDGMAATCLRFATVYGTSPRMRFDLTVNEFSRDLAMGGELVVFGEQFWRPYVHVRDAARAIVHVLEAPGKDVAGEVFNVGDTGENYRKLDIVCLLRERFPNGDVKFVHRDEDPRDYRVSFERIAGELGFVPRMRVPDGIGEVVEGLEAQRFGDPFSPAHSNLAPA